MPLIRGSFQELITAELGMYPCPPAEEPETQQPKEKNMNLRTEQGAFGYLQNNLVGKILELETDQIIVFKNYTRFQDTMYQIARPIGMSGSLKHNSYTLESYIQSESIRAGYNRDDLFLPIDGRNDRDLDEKHFTSLPNVPKLATMVRSHVSSIRKCLNDTVNSGREAYNQAEFEKILFSHMQIEMWFTTIHNGQKGKTTFLDKFLAENIQTVRGTKLKCLITNEWPKYRGMFGDHNSCFYPSREHEAGMRAAMRFGYIARFYTADVTEQQILNNPDNPLELDNPLNTAQGSYNDREIEGTDGCAGRALIAPSVLTTKEANSSVPTDNQDIAIYNCYLHGSKCPSLSKSLVASWLSNIIPNSYDLGKKSLGGTGNLYVNNSSACIVSRIKPSDLYLNRLYNRYDDKGYAYLNRDQEKIVELAYEVLDEDQEYDIPNFDWDEYFQDYEDSLTISESVKEPEPETTQSESSSYTIHEIEDMRSRFAEKVANYLSLMYTPAGQVPSFSAHPIREREICIHYGPHTTQIEVDLVERDWTNLDGVGRTDLIREVAEETRIRLNLTRSAHVF